MGEVDIEAKAFFAVPDVVADVFNYWVYKGKNIIKPEELRPLDTTEIVLPYRNNAKKPIQRIRDVLKLYTAMRDNQAYYLVLGIEIQTGTHYALPVKNMLYDAMSYAQQVAEIAAKHRKNKDKMTGEKYLSGITKEDKLMPVITLVVSLSAEAWDGPLSIHEMFSVKNEELLAFVPDYRLNLLAPNLIDDMDFPKFQTELGVLLGSVKHRYAQTLGWIWDEEPFRHMSRETASLIKKLTGFNFAFDKSVKEVDMLNAWENGLNQARNDGISQGISHGKVACAMQVAKEFNIPIEKIIDVAGISKAEWDLYAPTILQQVDKNAPQ